MKVTLVGINAKYIHSNLAIHSLRAYCKDYKDHIQLLEYTINNRSEEILKEIYKSKPDVIAFSCYIWNIGMILELQKELYKILPHVDIWLGGPEVSYDGREILEKTEGLRGVIAGEGEETFYDLMGFYVHKAKPLNEIQGIIFKDSANLILETGSRKPMCLDDIPFPYDDLDSFENKILYYEASRGCPFDCSYCLSGSQGGVRFRSLALVKKEFQIFLDKGVKQVKLVDRTFNCSRKYALAIWQFLKQADNGHTNFHFEIAADLLDDETIEFLNTVRPGYFQFEIGVQSTNPDTIKAIQRKMDFFQLSEVVKKIQRGNNIQQHLDLIAGLPLEDLDTFKRSFNMVYALRPEQLQLGFLKILKGSTMYWEAERYGIVYRESAPYEVLFTKYISYGDLLRLKGVEEMLELHYNSWQFSGMVCYLERTVETPFELYQELHEYYDANGLYQMSHNRMTRYEILKAFALERRPQDRSIIDNLILYDLYLQEKLKKRPDDGIELLEDKERIRIFYQEEKHRNLYFGAYGDYNSKQISRMTHIEVFTIDVLEYLKTGQVIQGEYPLLFDYKTRDKLTYHARALAIELNKEGGKNEKS